MWTNDINVLEIPESSSPTNASDASDIFTWLYNITDPTLGLSNDDTPKKLEGGAIASIAVTSLVAAVLFITLAWKLCHKKGGLPTIVTAVWDGMLSMIWDRR